MSAADVIAEALDDHRRSESARDCIEGVGWVWACWCECGWHGRDSDHQAHAADHVLAALKAAGFVVATPEDIRAWPVSEQAEILGGEVESGIKHCGQVFTVGASGSNRVDRVVGPWREVQQP